MHLMMRQYLFPVMYVNNEIGAVEPIEKIGHIIKDYNPDIVYHVDAIQAYGKYKIYPKKLGIDLLSVSGHKIHELRGADSYSLMIRQESSLLYMVEDSRRACVQELKMFRL